LVLALAGIYRWRDLALPGLVLVAATGLVLFVALRELSPIENYFFSESGGGGASSAVTTMGSSLLIRILFLLVPLAVAPSAIRWRLTMPLVLPIIGLLLRGGNGLTTFYHYDMMFVPLLVLIVALSPAARLSGPRIALASVLVIVAFGPLRPIAPRYGPNPFRYDREIVANLDEVADAVRAIEGHETLSLASPSRLLPHFSERMNAFIYPSPHDPHEDDNSGYDYVESVTFDCPDPNIVVADRGPAPVFTAHLEESYDLIESKGAYSLWLRREPASDTPCTASWIPAT
jgi:hypothetical protein